MEKSCCHHDMKMDDVIEPDGSSSFLTSLKTASGHYYMDVKR
jgi:hypothetical protein